MFCNWHETFKPNRCNGEDDRKGFQVACVLADQEKEGL